MAADNSTPGWLLALLGAVAGIVASVLTYLGVIKKERTEEKKVGVELVRVGSGKDVELTKLQIESERVQLEERKAGQATLIQQLSDYRAFIDGMRGRITQLETGSDEKDKVISDVQRQQRECTDKHEDCERRVADLTKRVVELEKRPA